MIDALLYIMNMPDVDLRDELLPPSASAQLDQVVKSHASAICDLKSWGCLPGIPLGGGALPTGLC